MNEEYDSDSDSYQQKVTQLAVNINYIKIIREINAAIYKPLERKFFVTKFEDNANFSNFESFLLQVIDQNDFSKSSLMINFPESSTEKGIL